MTSLTPHTRNAEATASAMEEGLLSGAMMLVPSAGVVYYLSQHVESFAKRTNMQSRTALAIMPALFMFAFTAETRLTHKMHGTCVFILLSSWLVVFCTSTLACLFARL